MINGIFIEECKNRFLCLVNVDGKIEECYVSSSSRLSNYITLEGKKVLLTPNKGENLRTAYTLQAAYCQRHWVFLNLNAVNDIYEEYLLKRLLIAPNDIHREYNLDNYKMDFFIESQSCIIEVKCILADTNVANYPYVSCGRSARQLKAILEKLRVGYAVDYAFVILNSVIKQVNIYPPHSEVADLFEQCIREGMKIKFYGIRWYKEKYSLIELHDNRITFTC